jgi:crotonobetainyl-CoA:carnitine CoA-transferase CaiB-like acyl-CoA transferase
MPEILKGVRVIDLSSVIAGPFATQMLGDLGADVIKVERPSGDSVRQTGRAKRRGMSAMFLHNNRNKRSVCLDLKSEAGRKVLLRLVEGCDVCIHNIRPAAMQRLGLDWETLKRVNPRLIHVNIVGYGQDGPYAAYPAYDDMIQAAAALPSLAQRAGASAPRYVPIVIADRAAGYAAVNAVLAALLQRGRTGAAQNVEVPMFEVMTEMVLLDHLSGRTFVPPIGDAGYERLMSSNRRPFRTADGMICALIYNDANWQDFLALAGHGHLFEADHDFRRWRRARRTSTNSTRSQRRYS